MSAPVTPVIPDKPPPRQLSRHENMFRSPSVAGPNKNSRLSMMGGQRMSAVSLVAPERNSSDEGAGAEVPLQEAPSNVGGGRALPRLPTGTSLTDVRGEGSPVPPPRKMMVERTQSTPDSNQREPTKPVVLPRPPGNRPPPPAPVRLNKHKMPPAPCTAPPSSVEQVGATSGPLTPTPPKPVIPSKPSPTPPARGDTLTASRPPAVPPKPQLPPKPVVLTEEEHDLVCEACKKFGNANKQLLAVSRSTLGKVRASLSPVKVEFLNAQLGVAAEDLLDFNNRFLVFVKEAQKAYDHKKTCNISCLTVDLANFSSIICAALKLAASECESDASVFKTSFLSISTVRDSLAGLVDALSLTAEKVDASLIPQLQDHLKKTSSTLASLVGNKCSGPLISLGARMETEAAARAAVVSIAKLVNSFNSPLEQSILTEAKVASCCVAQLWGVLNESLAGTNMLAMPAVRETVSTFGVEIKQQFADFMQRTKEQVANPSVDAFAIMKENERPMRALLHEIVASFRAFSEVDTSDRESLDDVIKPTEEHLKKAETIVADPPEIVPPPPASFTQSSLDIPDDYVESTESIWDEPEEDEGRVLFSDNGNLRCSTLNKLIIHTTANLDMNRMKTFITTYRSFTTPEVLLDKIIQRYHVPTNDAAESLPIQLRCCNALKYLIETQYEEFSDTFLSSLDQFLGELATKPAYLKFANTIQTALQKVSFSFCY
jgi:hypothetical protein